MYTSLLTEILAFLLGRKYWANIVSRRGTTEVDMACYIFRTKEAAEKHRQGLQTNDSYAYVETVSYRSRTLEKSLPNP